ncbi:MAG: T9SS type A sorting domain-containing protein [Sphingobacteriales bacterium]|nr:MAG: T9SS type A sorting domain-containing protein [Sphingobacteriales bacterium]
MKRLILFTFMVLTMAAGSSAQPRGASFASDPVSVLRFYPNPATTQVTFDFSRSYDRGYSIQIFNFLGRKVYEAGNVGQRTSLDLTDYLRGVYIYQLRDKNGKMVETGKFQVSK